MGEGSRGVALLDSSPLLLWLAGRTDTRIIDRFKHLAMFQVDDYKLLDRLLLDFRTILITPHILTEVSNHSRHLKGSYGDVLSETFVNFAEATLEIFTASSTLRRLEEFKTLGLTDCALVEADSEVTVITADFRLAGHLEAKGRQVSNLNHLRQARLLP